MTNVNGLLERLHAAEQDAIDRFLHTKSGTEELDPLEFLKSLPWAVTGQGGGCLALSTSLPWGGEALITEKEGVDVPEDDEDALLGFYDEDYAQEACFSTVPE